MKGTIFDIQRFSIHDGPGIRTTVFMKGCPLRCQWCHNPEGLCHEKQVQFFEETCISCGRCGGKHDFAGAEVCPSGALKVCGREIEAEDLLKEVLRDRDFYGSDGGVTFSGGECLAQADFVAEMLRLCHENGVGGVVDTSGYVPQSSLAKTLPYAKLYLYDVKCADSQQHKKYTGVYNERILENLQYLENQGASIWIRVPVIPGFNDNFAEMEHIAQIVKPCRHAEKVTLMPYHTLGKSKYETLGMKAPYNTDQIITKEKLEDFKNIFRKQGITAD